MLESKQKNINLTKYASAKALVRSIKQQLMGQTDLGIRVGKTKVFFCQKAFDLLEKL